MDLFKIRKVQQLNSFPTLMNKKCRFLTLKYFAFSKIYVILF